MAEWVVDLVLQTLALRQSGQSLYPERDKLTTLLPDNTLRTEL
jgi:hypothetical protein